MEKLLDLFVCSFVDWVIMLVVNKRMLQYCGNAHENSTVSEKGNIAIVIFVLGRGKVAQPKTKRRQGLLEGWSKLETIV